MTEIRTSVSGLPYAVIDGKQIHSSHDPMREAERFLGLRCPERAPVYIVAGPGLCYINRAIAARESRSRVISIHLHDFFFERQEEKKGLEWHPSSPEPLDSFLFRVLADHDIEGLAYLEWKPSFDAAPETGMNVARRVRSVLRVLNGNVATTSAFGRIWWRNTFANVVEIGSVLPPFHRGVFPVIIAAPGPTLSRDVAPLKKLRCLFFLIALASSLKFLAAHGLVPDLVVSTDPGGYASFHLDPSDFDRVPIAMPLTGCRGIGRWNSPVLLIHQGTLPERIFIESLALPAVGIPQNGTVAGTALLLAAKLTAGPILLAGLDMGEYDILSHARPHTFDWLRDMAAGRIAPSYSLSFRQSRDRTSPVPGTAWRSSLPLENYAAWFSSAGTTVAGGNAVFRVDPSPVPIEGLAPVGMDGIERVLSGFEKPVPLPLDGAIRLGPARERSAHVVSVISRIDSTLRAIGEEDEPGWGFFENRCPDSFELIWLVETRGVLEYRKSLREEGKSNSGAVWSRIVCSCADFFRKSRERIEHA